MRVQCRVGCGLEIFSVWGAGLWVCMRWLASVANTHRHPHTQAGMIGPPMLCTLYHHLHHPHTHLILLHHTPAPTPPHMHTTTSTPPPPQQHTPTHRATMSEQSRRREVEMYAHTLRTRLQLASIKALGTKFDAAPVQPLATSLVANTTDDSQVSTPALSQTESSSSSRSTRSIYLDIFGTDFRPKSLSRTTSFASSSSRPRSGGSPCASTSGSTRSLLDRTASSPQLGSPERSNGRFDWHNNPTPAMVAHETRLATPPFALPVSPCKRRRETSHTTTTTTPRRSRLHSTGFLPNGHPASSLAQDLGLTTPRTPRSRHASGRHILVHAVDQDQEERDRVATTLAALAESRAASSGSDSSGSDRPHTPPQHGLGIGFSPTLKRTVPPAKRHKRNVSWSVPALPAAEEEAEDRTAADYLLFLASSPSASSIKRFSSDIEPAAAGVLATPAHTSLWDPFGEPRSRTTTQRGEPLTPPPSARKPSAAAAGVGGLDTPRDAHEYMATRTPRSPRTPPPSTLRNSGCFEVGTPAAPGGDTNFHYADFVNVSPSPQPPSTGRFANTYAPRGELRTPTKINRHRFERPS